MQVPCRVFKQMQQAELNAHVAKRLLQFRREGRRMNDYISRQAAIDVLDVLCQEHRYKIPGKVETYSTYNEAWQDALDRAEGAIGNLPFEQQWIPCSERLPENEDIYLVTFDKSNLLDNETQVSDAYWINNQWQYGVLESYERRMPKLVIEPIEELKVIAWMPSPEPYKGEDE